MNLRSIGFALFIWLAAAPLAGAHPRAFVAVETADIGRAQAWYARVFDAQLVSSFSEPTYEQRVLRGPDLIIELVQRAPPRAPTGEGVEIMKAGIVVDDLDNRVARWTAQGVEFLGRRIHDDALDLDAVLIVDPDGNMIQVFGRVEDVP